MFYTKGTKVRHIATLSEVYTGYTTDGRNPTVPVDAYYDMYDISGVTLADQTGNYPGTLVNGPTRVDSPHGKALNCVPASTQYVEELNLGTALGNNISELSVSLWFEVNTLNRNSGLFYVGDLLSSHGQFEVNINNPGLLRVRVSNANFDEQIPFSITDFAHIITVYTGSKVQLYLNNVLTSINGNHSTNLNLSGLKTVFGLYNDINTALVLDGQIASARIYQGVWTDQHRNDLANEKVGPWVFENGYAV